MNVVELKLNLKLDEAVEILNSNRHRGCPCWRIDGDLPFDRVVVGYDEDWWFEPFEAVAVSEKYIRDVAAQAKV